MIPSHLSRLAALIAVVQIAGLPLLMAGSGPYVPTLQPYQVSSPNGEFIFEVTPSARDGSGTSIAWLTRKSSAQVAWKRKLPYTFWQACVNDDGVVGGFGYTTGPMGGSIFGGKPGVFFIRILDAEGTALHTETTRVALSQWYFSSPSAERVALDAENNRMVIDMHNSTFRSYNLHRGELINAVHMSRDALPVKDCTADNFRVVPRSPLLLLELPHWTEKEDGTEVVGSVFALMNRSGRLVWTFNHQWFLPEDWQEFNGCEILSLTPCGNLDADPFGGAPEADGDDRDPFAEDPDPFAPDDKESDAEKKDDKGADSPPARPIAEFVLYLDGNAHGQRVAFQLSDAGIDNEHVWKVTETKREKWTLPEENVIPPELPRLKGTKLGQFTLRGSDQKPLPDLAAVVLGPNEQIYAFDRESRAVHVFDREGQPLHLCQPRAEDPLELHGSPLTVSDKGEVYLKLNDTLFDEAGKYLGPNPNQGRYLQFSPKGVRQDKLASLRRDDYGREWFAQPGTTNILVAGVRDEIELVRRDKGCPQVANLTHRADGNWLVDLDDIAFAPDGSFAIRTSSMEDYPTPFPVIPSHRPAEAIAIFDRKGNPVRTIDFADGASFHYIAFDGSHLVATRHYHPPHPFVFVLDATGEPVGVFKVDEFVDVRKPAPNPRPFIVNKGSEILLVDLAYSEVSRYALPK